MNIIIVTQKLDQNDENLGAFYPWFEEFARRFDRVVILAGSVGRVEFPPHVHVQSWGKGKGSNRLARVWKFWELFSEHYAHADVVFFHQIPEFVLAAAPFLVTHPRRAVLWYAHGSVSRKVRWAERLVDDVFTSSPAGFRLPSKKVFYMGQAVDTERFQPSPHHSAARPQALRMVSVGRMSPIKEYETMIRAAKILQDGWDREWTFSLVGGPLRPGDETYLARLKKLVEELRLNARIHFYGARPYSEIPGILREHDLFLNLSRTGSLDKAVLEAMACGLSVITSNDAYGSLIPPAYYLERITPEFLAERIKTLAPEPRPNLELRSIVEREHSLQKTLQKMVARLTGEPVLPFLA